MKRGPNMKLIQIKPFDMREMMDLNVALKTGKITNVEITPEIALLIQQKLLSISRCKTSFSITPVPGIVATQVCEMAYAINKGWTCMTIKAHFMGDTLVITKINGDSNEVVRYGYKLQGAPVLAKMR